MEEFRESFEYQSEKPVYLRGYSPRNGTGYRTWERRDDSWENRSGTLTPSSGSEGLEEGDLNRLFRYYEDTDISTDGYMGDECDELSSSGSDSSLDSDSESQDEGSVNSVPLEKTQENLRRETTTFDSDL